MCLLSVLGRYPDTDNCELDGKPFIKGLHLHLLYNYSGLFIEIDNHHPRDKASEDLESRILKGHLKYWQLEICYNTRIFC